jgi:hypothetical protein
MPAFVKVGQRFFNLEYVSRVEPQPDGTAKIYVDDMPPQTVPEQDLGKLMEALRPPEILNAELREAFPLVSVGIGGTGIPAGMFRTQPEQPLVIPAEPPVAPIPVPAVPVAPETSTPAIPVLPELTPQAVDSTIPAPGETVPEPETDKAVEPTTGSAKPKSRKPAA